MTTEVPQHDFQQNLDSGNEWSSLPHSSSADSATESSSNELHQEGNTANASTQHSESTDIPLESTHLPESSDEVADTGSSDVTPRYPVRQRRPPVRLKDYMNSEDISSI